MKLPNPPKEPKPPTPRTRKPKPDKPKEHMIPRPWKPSVALPSDGGKARKGLGDKGFYWLIATKVDRATFEEIERRAAASGQTRSSVAREIILKAL